MKKLFTFAIILIIASAVFTYAQEIKLEYKYKEGDTNVYKEVSKNNSNVEGEGAEAFSAKDELIGETTEKIEKVNPDGSAKVILSSNLTSLTSNGESLLSEDSNDNKSPKTAINISKFGKILSVEDENGEKIPDFNVGKQKGLFPEKAVKIGDEWTGMLIMDTLDSPLKCKLEKVYSSKGVDIAEITFTVDDKESLEDALASAGESNSEEYTGFSGLRKVTGNGKIYFSLNLGKMILLEYKITVETTVSSPDFSNKSSSDIDYKMWRIK